MNDTERVLNLVDLMKKASHAEAEANVDPALRKALQEAISLVRHMISDRSWAADPQAKQELLKTLRQTVAMLQVLSDRTNQN